MSTIIIQASSRKTGNTALAVDQVKSLIPSDSVDLLDYKFSGYDYLHLNQNDDFLPLVERLASNYDTWILATPVYWYSMSGLLKNFVDRLTDCVTIAKPIGRSLEGKRLGLLSSSSEEDLLSSFAEPFRLTAEYLEMTYIGHAHTWCIDEDLAPHAKENIKSFVSLIKHQS